ncbi:MAG TPA: hypothetical protein PLR25_10480, partial [Planctomycetaceae bacterium]|nr:hypothetical protein [Planctomycetaceae bacterium]
KAASAKRYAETALARADAENQRDPVLLGRVLEAKITSRDSDQGYLKLIVDYNKAITDLNFRKGAILHTNSIFLAEGEWNPEAYEDARVRGEAMSRALDNVHLTTVPEEFVGGPDVNSWESLGIPSRPHVPGVVENLNPPNFVSEAVQPHETFQEGPALIIEPAQESQLPNEYFEIPSPIVEPVQESPLPKKSSEQPVNPPKKNEPEFIDPVYYNKQVPSESKISSRSATTRSRRAQRAENLQNESGRATLD